MLEGYKTYIGIATTIIGLVLQTTGLDKFISSDLIVQLINAIIVVVGLVITIYGNIKSHQRIAELENQ